MTKRSFGATSLPLGVVVPQSEAVQAARWLPCEDDQTVMLRSSSGQEWGVRIAFTCFRLEQMRHARG